MSHFTLCALAGLDPATKPKFDKLCKDNQDTLVDFFAKKLEKPLQSFDINNNENDNVNESGKFDYYSVSYVMPVDEMLAQFEDWDRIPRSILLPNLKWIESDEWFYSVSEYNIIEYNKWLNKVKEILGNHTKDIAILIDCHI